MSLFKNKYRVESFRLKNWDYGWNAKYFVTIVTKNREHFFGEIRDAKINPEFGWQSRFHDCIIRDDAEYKRIKKYIINNPNNWVDDTFY